MFYYIGFLIVFISLSFTSCTESETMKFHELEFCEFKPVKEQGVGSDSLYIAYYVRVENNDSVFAIENFSDSGDSLYYYRGKIPGKKRDSLYSVFNGRDLQQYFSTKKLDSGEFYAGKYNFFYVSYPENKSDSITFISLFVKPALNTASD